MLVIGIAAVYLGLLIAFTVGFADDVPTGAWIGFGVVAAVVTGLVLATIVLFERIGATAGADRAGLAPPPADGRRRLLVVADAGCDEAEACPLVLQHVRGAAPTDVLVVAPVIASPVAQVFDDEGTASAKARHRLDEIVGLLRRQGVDAQGLIGSDLPLEAMHDALAVFPADEVVLLAPAQAHAAWGERDLLDRASTAFGRPVTHVVVERARPAVTA